VALTALRQFDAAAQALADALAAQRAMENHRGESESLTHLAALQLAHGMPEEGAQSAAEAERIAATIGATRYLRVRFTITAAM
jgi:hypothetical protein